MSNNKDQQKSMDRGHNVVIAGSGIIGISTAYYLAQNHNHISRITIIDPTSSIAPAASGKAGGFLALDWNDHSPIGPLARRSFVLHQELADLFGSERIMYRRLTCASISVAAQITGRRKPRGKKLEGVEWVEDDSAAMIQPLGDENTIAQVHPKMLCEAMWDAVQQKDDLESVLLKGKVIEGVYEENSYDDNEEGSATSTAMNNEKEKKLVGAKLEDGTIIDADMVLFACGPWTKTYNCMLGVKYHSAIIPTRPRVLNQSVFFHGCGDPEVYPRPDGTAYCTGFPDAATRVSEQPGKEEVRKDKIDQIVEAVREASGSGRAGGVLGNEPELKQSCYLPTTIDNLPMIGELPDQRGCFVAAGHGCWGILLGPATGEAVSSLMVNGKSETVNLASFRPERFQSM